MATGYLENNNFESLHSSQLQHQKGDPAILKRAEPIHVRGHRAIDNVSELPNFDPPLTSRAAAAVLGLSYSNFKKMRARGEGPTYYKTERGTIRYLLSWVKEYQVKRTIVH